FFFSLTHLDSSTRVRDLQAATTVNTRRKSPRRTEMTRQQEAQQLQSQWTEDARWKNIRRGYTAQDVVRLRGSVQVEHTLAKRGAEKLWALLNEEPFVKP